MNRIVFFIALCYTFPGIAQEGPETDPKAVEASLNLTWEAGKDLESEDFINAEAKYRRAIAKSAENAAAPYNLGNAYYQKESYSEAFGRFREAGERAGEKPDKHRAYHNMGNVYMQRKEYEQAIEAYKEALRNDPTDEETRYNLALAKELLKKDPQQQQNDQNEEDQQQEDQQEQEEQNQDQDQGGEDQQEQNEDQNQQEGDSEKEENKEGDGPEKEEKQQKPNPSEQEEQKRPPRPNQLSPQQIENLLEAMENEEKKVKEKIDALKVKGPKVKKEKDW
jgi:tetratricopeptide (TPR) repeat protein